MAIVNADRLENGDRWISSSRISRRVVCEQLQRSVASMVLIHRGSAADHVCVLPDTQATMVMQLAGEGERDMHGQPVSGWLLGAPTRAYSRTTNEPLTLVVTFKPSGAFTLLKTSMSALTDVSASLDDVWGKGARRLYDRVRAANSDEERFDIVEQSLCEQMEGRGTKFARDGRLVREVCERMRGLKGNADSSHLTRVSGCSERHLRRIFRDVVGLNPHLSWRIERFNRAVRLARRWDGRDVTWGGIAADVGYYDQAHMTAEFQEFTNVSPGRFLNMLKSGFPHLHDAWFEDATIARTA